MCNNYFAENRDIYKIMWKNYGRAGQATDDNKIRRMSLTSRVTKTIVTQSEHVIFTFFQRQKWLRERATMLRYTYIVWLVFSTLRTCVCVCV
jgi:hypothetical protein